MQIEYYDGQFDDSRYALALAQTAALHGAPVLNHTTAMSLVKDSVGKVIGAKVKDNETGAVTTVHARVVINATGPFTDGLRQMADDKAEGIIMPSAGAPRTSARHSRRIVLSAIHQIVLTNLEYMYTSGYLAVHHRV